jgi:hypothetical protein
MTEMSSASLNLYDNGLNSQASNYGSIAGVGKSLFSFA